MSLKVLAIVFWGTVAVTLYAYVVFPLLTLILARLGRTRERVCPASPPARVVTVIIPAYNEELNLDSRIRNVLASDYPRQLLDVIVVSDASTDRTNEIARRFETDGVRLIVQERRMGKSAGLNLAVARARGEVVVFTDANSSYAQDTIVTLARYFDQPQIGLVTGCTRYTAAATGQVSEATNAYTTLERTIKRGESRWGCCVGADGAIFAMRRALYRELRDDDINDLVLPLEVIDQGQACVLAEDAYCGEHPANSLDSEFRRQSRITGRTLCALWRHVHLLNPFRYPAFSFFLASHKVVRFLVPLLLPLSALALVILSASSRLYAAMSAAGLLIVAFGTVRGRLHLPMIKVFLTINLAMLDGWRKFVTRRTEITWQHDRSAAPESR